MWAIGVITFFLLCGYPPFDRDSNLEEMQAILAADYSYTPEEHWNGISQTAKDFIDSCLTIDPNARLTANQALNHPWIKEEEDMDLDMAGRAPDAAAEEKRRGSGVDLLPTVRKNFNARLKLHAAIDTIRAINQLRAGHMASAMMNGAKSGEPARGNAGPPVPAAVLENARPGGGEEMEGVEGTGQLGSGAHDQGGVGWEFGGRDDSGYGTLASSSVAHGDGGEGRGNTGDRMEVDSRGHGKGQTEEQIREQERKIRETMQGLWGKR